MSSQKGLLRLMHGAIIRLTGDDQGASMGTVKIFGGEVDVITIGLHAAGVIAGALIAYIIYRAQRTKNRLTVGMLFDRLVWAKTKGDRLKIFFDGVEVNLIRRIE